MRSRKVLFAITAGAIVASLLAALVTLSFIRSSFLHVIAESLQTVRDTTHQAVRSWAIENEHHIEILAGDLYLRSLTEELLSLPHTPSALLNAPVQQRLRAYLRPILAGHKMRGYFIIAPDNISLSSTRDTNIGTANLLINQPDFLNRLWAGETVITLPQRSDVPLPNEQGDLVENYPTMFVGAPIRNQDNRVIALLALRLDPKANLEEIVQRGRIDTSGETYLIDSEGVLLTESRFTEQLWELNILPEGSSSALEIKAVVPSVPRGTGFSKTSSELTKMAASALKDEAGFDVSGYMDYRGKMVIGAWLWDTRYDFGLATEVDLEEAYLPYQQTEQSFIAFICAAIVFFCAVTGGLIRLQKRIQSHEIQYRSLFENAGDPILIADCDTGNILSANSLAYEFLQYSSDELVGLHISRLRSNSTWSEVAADIEEVVRVGKKLIETEYQTKAGKLVPVETSARLVAYGQRQVILSIVRDITARKNTERRLVELANTDMLTGLGNRASFDNRLKQMLSSAGTEKRKLVLLFFDIDEFRIINNTLGHTVGDRTLQIVAKLISESTPSQACSFRFGGDEFTVIAAVDQEKEAADIGRAVHHAFKSPLVIGDNELHLTVSTGIAIAPRDGADAIGLLQSADTALYAAKRQGRNRCEFFSEDMRYQDALHLTISKALNHALENKEFSLVFQPVVRTNNGELVGAEALIRWNSPELGMVRPDVFIPVAEQSGRINEIGGWVLDEACRVRAHWLSLGLSDIKMSINLSPVQMLSSDIPSLVSKILDKYGLEAHSIALEVTEGVLLESQEMYEQLKQLRELGVYLYLDDFGTGYSSLSYVSKYPFNFIKLDKSFVMDMEENPRYRSLAKTVISMADSLGLEVIAEGVETQWQSDFLKENGCHRIQGYLYGKPVGSEEFLRQWRDRFSGSGVIARIPKAV